MSKPIVVTIPHALGRAEAHRRLDAGFDDMAAKLPGGFAQLHKSWKDERLNFSAQVMGQGINGVLDILDDAVRVELHLPGFLAMIADKIKGRLQKEGTLLLEKK